MGKILYNNKNRGVRAPAENNMNKNGTGFTAFVGRKVEKER